MAPSILPSSSVFVKLRLHLALSCVYLKPHFLASFPTSPSHTLLYSCAQVQHFQAEPLLDPSSQAHLAFPSPQLCPSPSPSPTVLPRCAWSASPIPLPSWAFPVVSSCPDPA